MLADIRMISILENIAKCKHKWEYLHDTKYDNIGFRDKYPLVLVCTKCGKIKIVKENDNGKTI